MKIISLSNQKGGVGKTTTTVNLAVGLVKKGKKILIIDMDYQGHASKSLGEIKPKKTIYDFMLGKVTLEETIVQTEEGVDLLPSDIQFAGLEHQGIPGKELILKSKIKEEAFSKYDYILIDCPPSIGVYTLNAFNISDEIIVVLQTEFLALDGINLLTNTINLSKQTFSNHKLKIGGIIATMFDKRINAANEILEAIKNIFPNEVFETVIRRNTDIAEAPSYGVSVLTYNPKSNGAKDYNDLTEEFLKRNEAI